MPAECHASVELDRPGLRHFDRSMEESGVDGRRGFEPWNRLFGEASRLERLDRKINKEWDTEGHVCTTCTTQEKP